MDWAPAHHHRVPVGCERALELLARMHEVPVVANSVEEVLGVYLNPPLVVGDVTNSLRSAMLNGVHLPLARRTPRSRRSMSRSISTE